MTKLIIWDIDGTLANAQHRIHHIKPPEGQKRNWGKFFHQAASDPIFKHTAAICKTMRAAGMEAWMVTGRPENFRNETLDWLGGNDIPCDRLFMRPADERKPDYEVKRDIYLNHIAGNEVLCVFEDRLPVAKMWTELGLPVCLCGDEWITNDWSK